jgi:16S rRNA (adenine1518-N6/adenine1519-N6)-dimethyltransferase
MTAPRQTLSWLRGLLEERNIRPKGKLGQNFLIDLNLIDLIVRAAELTREDLVLEVGSGTGSLTARLADEAGAVVSVEVDPAFQLLSGEILAGRENLTLVAGDVLRHKNEIAPDVLAAVDAARAKHGTTRLKLVANLPYVVATPVIANLLLQGERPLERMVVMVQWEIAERMTAGPGSPVYSSLAVLAQSLADVSVVRRLAPTVFWPRPKVDSAIVLLRPNAEKRARVPDPLRWRAFLRDLYTHRRKNLRGALAGWPQGRRPKDEVDRQLADLGIDGNIRAEELSIDDHLRLCAVFG